MAECEHLERTSMYFDGALAEADEAAAADHLATCAECQALLQDAAVIDAVISTGPAAAAPAAVIPIASARGKRWPIFAVSIGLAAAAALAVWLTAPRRPGPADQIAITLPPERALEARFSGDRFDHHRPYAPLRGDRAHEAISLEDLAALERHHATADLIAALAATGDLQRAGELAAQRRDPNADADRAALALAGGQPEIAIDLAYRALAASAAQPPAWWNLALAARDLDLPRVSRDAFRHAASVDEPGWADEARRHIDALDHRIAADHRDAAGLRSRAADDERAGKAGLAKAERAEAQLIETP